MAERRHRRASAIRDEVADGLRSRATDYADRGSDIYDHLGARLVRRAERIERGERMVVQGFEVPGRQALGLDPSAPYLLHPDGRLTVWPATADAGIAS